MAEEKRQSQDKPRDKQAEALDRQRLLAAAMKVLAVFYLVIGLSTLAFNDVFFKVAAAVTGRILPSLPVIEAPAPALSAQGAATAAAFFLAVAVAHQLTLAFVSWLAGSNIGKNRVCVSVVMFSELLSSMGFLWLFFRSGYAVIFALAALLHAVILIALILLSARTRVKL